MESLKVTGHLRRVMEAQQVTDKLKKQEFVIETVEQYPQVIKLELVNDKCSLLDGINVGTLIECHFNLRGREWKKDANNVIYFNTLQAWKITKLDGDDKEPEPVKAENQPVKAEVVSSPDDLPF